MQIKTRRDFVKLSAMGFGLAIFAPGMMAACDDQLSDGVEFLHGVASGDPLTDRVIIWTRVTPTSGLSPVRIAWEVAVDREFRSLVNTGTLETSSEKDFTIKVDAGGLKPEQTYYYRFRSRDKVSAIGRTRTLPLPGVQQVAFAVVSCSNYPAGRFYVYREIAQRQDIDAVLHLGDYIYEYARGGYASSQAKQLGREVLPETEILSLADYRARYAQYRTDPDLQAVHQNHAFITVWDDHEITNNAWREGAENHQADEGSYEERKLHALRAYAEWLPIRITNNDEGRIYRSFAFGDLVDLYMLDTRIIGRDRPLRFSDYRGSTGLDIPALQADILDPSRSLLGEEQRAWLLDQLASSQAQWQVLGQQVLMGRMYLPGALATGQISLSGFARLLRLAKLAAQGQTLSTEEQAFLTNNQGLLRLPTLPSNLDAWDAFEVERQGVLSTAKTYDCNLVVLAGDTHNAWANNLTDLDNTPCGVEFATPSVSSPGLEVTLGLSPESVPATEQQLSTLFPGLKYTNVSDRGYLLVTFTKTETTAEFTFVDNVLQERYRVLTERSKTIKVRATEKKLV